jgi:hypothetical protein
MRVALLVLALSSCAAGPHITPTALVNTSSSRGPVAGDVPTCEEIACGGTADPVEIGVGVAVILGIVLARVWYER